MKFNEQQVLEKIKAEGKTTKISDRTIAAIVKPMMKLLGDESEVELDDFFKQVMPAIKEADGNINHRESEAYKEWEKKKTEPEKKREEQPVPEGEPAWFKAFREAQEQEKKGMQDAIAKLTGENRAKSIKTAAISKFQKDNEKFFGEFTDIAALMEKKYERLSIGESDTEETVIAGLSEVLGDYRTAAKIDANWKPGGGSNDGNGGGEVDVSKLSAVTKALGLDATKKE